MTSLFGINGSNDDWKKWGMNGTAPDPYGFSTGGLGSQISQPQSAATPSPSPSIPSGMFGAQPDVASRQMLSLPDTGSMTPTSIDAGTPNVKLKFFDQGGTGDKIINGLGAFADTYLAHQGDPYALQKFKDQDDAAQEQSKTASSLWQALMLQRLKPQEPGSIEKNFGFLQSQNPSLAQSYLRAEANPQTLMTNPVTQQVGFYPKGGIQPASGGPPQQAISALMSNPNLRQQFDAKYGAGASAQYLGQ